MAFGHVSIIRLVRVVQKARIIEEEGKIVDIANTAGGLTEYEKTWALAMVMVNQRNAEASQRLQGHPEKYGKGEPKAESKTAKLKSNIDIDYKNGTHQLFLGERKL